MLIACLYYVGEGLAILRAELKSQKKHVRSLKKKSLWSKILEEVQIIIVLNAFAHYFSALDLLSRTLVPHVYLSFYHLRWWRSLWTLCISCIWKSIPHLALLVMNAALRSCICCHKLFICPAHWVNSIFSQYEVQFGIWFFLLLLVGDICRWWPTYKEHPTEVGICWSSSTLCKYH